MSYDGTLNFDTSIDTTGFNTGISTIGSIASTGLKATLAIITAAAAGIVAFGKSAVEAGAEFDTAMSQLAATMGTTVDNISELEEKAKELGASTSFSATEAAEGLNILAQAGYNATEQINMIDSVLDLAAAGATSMDNAASYLTTTLKGYCVASEDVGDMTTYYSNLIAKGATLVNTSVDELGEALSTSAATANAYSQSVETTTTALLALADGGYTGSEAATGLNRVMQSLYAPTDAAATALDALGVACYDESGSARDLLDIIEDLQSSTSTLTEEQKNSYLSTILGTYGLKAYNAITTKTADEVDELTASLIDCEDAAANMAATQLDNLEGDITICKSALEGLEIAISDEVTPTLRELVQFGTEQLGVLTDAIGENGLQGGIEAIGDVLANLLAYVGELAPTIIETGSNLIHNFCEGLKDTALTSGTATSVVGDLISAFLSCAGDIWSTALVLLTSFVQGIADSVPDIMASASDMITVLVDALIEYAPQLITAAADIISQLIVGLGEGLPSLITEGVLLLTTIVQAILDNLPQLITAAVEAVNSFISGLDEMLPTLLDAAVTLFMALVDALPTVIDSLLAALPDLITTIVDFLADALPQIIEAAITMLNGLIEALPTIIESLVENLPSIITAIVSGLVSAVPQILEAGITLLMALIEAIPTIVSELLIALPDIITAIVTGLGDAIPDVFQAAKDLLWNIITAIPEIVLGLAEAVPDIISGIVNGLINGVSDVWDAACSLGQGILGGIKSFFGINSPSTVMEEQGDYLVQGMINGIESLPEDVAEYLSQTAQNIIEWGQNIASTALEAAQTFLNNVVTFFTQLPGKILDFITTALNNIKTWASNIATSAKTAASNFLSNVTSYFSQLPGKILSYVTSALSNIKSWATNIASTAKTAASNFINNIVNNIKNLPSKFLNYLNTVKSNVTSWGSNLASSFKSIGKNVIQGLINGISSMVQSLYNSIKNALSGLVSKAKSALGIGSPSKVFAEEIGEWIPPGIGEGVDDAMPALLDDAQGQMDELTDKMKATVAVETGKIEIDKTVTTAYKAQQENGASFEGNDTTVTFDGTIHTVVELDGDQVGESTTPVVDRNLARIDTKKKRGG